MFSLVVVSKIVVRVVLFKNNLKAGRAVIRLTLSRVVSKPTPTTCILSKEVFPLSSMLT